MGLESSARDASLKIERRSCPPLCHCVIDEAGNVVARRDERESNVGRNEVQDCDGPKVVACDERNGLRG